MADYFQGVEFAAETVVGFLVANAINDVQNKYNTLATNYFNDYQSQREFYFNVFQQSGELPFNTEQFGISFYSPQYTAIFNTGVFPPSMAWFFNPQIANRLTAIGDAVSTQGTWYRFASRYAPLNASNIQEISGSFWMDVSDIYDDWFSYMFRYEEHKRDVFNERRWADQMGSLSYGVKEAYAVEREMGTSFEVYDKAQGQLISSEDTLLNGLATFAGYRQMQKDVKADLGTLPNYQDSSFLYSGIRN
jgi:hypothetical protein